MRKKTQIVIVIIGLMALSACSDYQDTIDPSGIVYCSEGSPSTFNPQLDTSGTTIDATAYQLYDRLLNYDPVTNRIVPGLASSYTVSKDGLVYTFQLRRRVSFHTTEYFIPSRYFNASDVIFSFNRWLDEEHPYHLVSGGDYPYFESLNLAENIQSITRINGYRVEITLQQPDSSFLANLASDFTIILSAEYAQQLAKLEQQEEIDIFPIGTGPYRYSAYRHDRFLRFEPHNRYWRDQNVRQPLIYDITHVSSLRISKLLSGECDIIAFPGNEELDVLAEAEKIVVESKPGLNVGFWAFNTLRRPFDDKRVRTALAMAIDRDTLLNTIYFDNAVKAKGLVPPSSWAYDPSQDVTSYSPQMAKQLLKDAGLEEGFEMNIWAMPVQRAYNPNALKMAELIQNYLAAVNVKVNIITYAWSTFRKRLDENLYDSILIGWTADNLDPDNFFRPVLSCDSQTNRSNWCNLEYDQLINQALLETEQEKRTILYQKALAITNSELPLLPIAHANRYQPYRNSITGININPIGGISFTDVKRKP